MSASNAGAVYRSVICLALDARGIICGANHALDLPARHAHAQGCKPVPVGAPRAYLIIIPAYVAVGIRASSASAQ